MVPTACLTKPWGRTEACKEEMENYVIHPTRDFCHGPVASSSKSSFKAPSWVRKHWREGTVFFNFAWNCLSHERCTNLSCTASPLKWDYGKGLQKCAVLLRNFFTDHTMRWWIYKSWAVVPPSFTDAVLAILLCTHHFKLFSAVITVIGNICPIFYLMSNMMHTRDSESR